MNRWALALDFGTTSTAAAMAHDERVELVRIDGDLRMPSMVFWREDTAEGPGALVLGADAWNWAAADPACMERAPKRRIGDESFRLGSSVLRVDATVGAILQRIASAAIEQRGGNPPTGVCLTYPARWGDGQRDALLGAAELAGLPDAVLVEEPIAAAVHFGSAELAPDEVVAVYDLGGGTFDTAVLRRSPSGFEIIGEPGGDQDIGGEDFDDRLYRYIGGQLDPEHWAALRASPDRPWRQANRTLQRELRRAKEALSSARDCPIYIPPPVDRPFIVTAGELEQLISEPISATVEELQRTIVDAGYMPGDLAGIYLAGGSSRIPLISRMITEQLGVAPKRLDDPKAAVVLGAARVIGHHSLGTAIAEADTQPKRDTNPLRTRGLSREDTERVDPASVTAATEPAALPAAEAHPPRPPDAGPRPADAGAPGTPPPGAPPPPPGTADRSRQPEPPRPRDDARRRRRGLIAAAGLLVLAAIIAGVVLATSASSGLSKAQWIAKADAICGSTFPQENADVSSGNLVGVEELSQQNLKNIRALGLPTQGGSWVTSWIAQEQNATDLLGEAVANRTSNPALAQQELSRASQIVNNATTAAAKFGMQVCSNRTS